MRYFWFQETRERGNDGLIIQRRKIVDALHSEAAIEKLQRISKKWERRYLTGKLYGPYFSRREAKKADLAEPTPLLLVAR